MSVLVNVDQSRSLFSRSDLSEGFNEKWLQELLFAEPTLVPLTDIEHDAGNFIPICRELGLIKPGGRVYLDIFGVTNGGRPVLIECKLWRNPAARREVVSQILEYAALLRRSTYADLTAQLKAQLKWAGQNPLFSHYRENGGTLSETAFSDSFARNLRSGDFHLIVAGDGIREDMSAIAEHIGDQGARLALVEFQRWADVEGRMLIVPSIPFRTEVLRRQLFLDRDGNALEFDTTPEDGYAELDPNAGPAVDSAKIENRAFWQKFIDQIEFDHPDQGRPRHGGNNWVRIHLPSPARAITAFRQKGRAGLFLVEEKGGALLPRLHDERDEIQAEFGKTPLRWFSGPNFDQPTLAVDEPEGTDDQLAWLFDMANRLVNVVRPRLG